MTGTINAVACAHPIEPHSPVNRNGPFLLWPHPRAAHPTDRRRSLASFLGQLKGLAFPVVEAFGIGPVHASAGDTVERGDTVTGTGADAVSLGVHDRDARVGR